MAGVAVVLVLMAGLFTVGIAVTVRLLLLYDKLFPEKEKGIERQDEMAVEARI